MEIHPRTLAATFRDMARERDAQAKGEHPGSAMLHHLYGEGDGLRAAAEHLEDMADREFDRIMAEHGVTMDSIGGPIDPSGIDCAEAHEGVQE